MRSCVRWLRFLSLLSMACGRGLDAHGSSNCPLANAVAGSEGFRRLALVVGVGQYKDPSITDLVGPPNDARRFVDLLTRSEDGYGFPKENVCLLLDAEATVAAFTSSFEQGLVRRARSGDVAVVFFAGHGSQAPDANRDEPDEWDETLVLHDSRSEQTPDLIDDVFNSMLSRLLEKTRNVTVVLDSCNSGTATRAAHAGTFVARYVAPASTRFPPTGAAAASTGDTGAGWAPENLPGLVVFSAASDGTSALETGGHGIFTDALVQVLSAAPATPLLYAQAARQIPPLVASRSYQIPYFHGRLDQPVFSNSTRARPVGWEVKGLAPLKLGGPPLPGVGVGAEFRIYPGNVTAADARDPARAKATVAVEGITGLDAQARLLTQPQGAPPIALGDLAVFVRPGDQYVRLKVRLRPPGESGGLPEAEAIGIRAAIAANDEAHRLAEVTNDAGDFELTLQDTGDLVSASGRSLGADPGTLILRGAENRIRNTYARPAAAADIANDLWRHARQRALLQLQGENGRDFRDNETLRVQLKPAPNQTQCAHGTWEQAEPNREQVVPLCHRWRVEVSLASDAPVPLLVGGLILSNDGSIEAFPSDASQVKVEPGNTQTFTDTFQGTTPLDVQDQVLVFGTQERNPVPWYLLASTATTRSAAVPATPSALYRALDLYLRPGARGLQPVRDVEETTWTKSIVSVRVEANARFLAAVDDRSGRPQTREYTIANFDIRPYLPDSPSASLHKVLMAADGLARRSIRDGVPYKQHDWSKPSDAENLKVGIDCSRSIWFAFTRSGLPYNPGDAYLTTAGMVGSSRMNQEFESCSNDPELRLGDVVVYRDDARGTGHVVMVIEPVKRIGWGSHGWDGNVTEGGIADTGVEYQLIKYKKDWQRWDRPAMQRKACWRYKKFAAEAVKPQGQPGLKALADVCNQQRQCGRLAP